MTWASRIEVELIAREPGTVAGGGDTLALVGDLDALHLKRGRRLGTERVSPGTLEVSLLYAAADAWTIRNAATDALFLGSLVTLRVRVDAGTWIPLYAGMVRQIADVFELDGRLRVTLRCIDRLGQLASADPQTAGIAYSAETVFSRLSFINTSAEGALDTDSFIDKLSNGENLQANATPSRNFLDEAMLSADSGFSELWSGRSEAEGLKLRSRAELRLDRRYLDEQVEWTNVPALITGSVWDTAVWDTGVWGAAGDVVGTTAFSSAADLDELANWIAVQRTGGSLLSASDTPSRVLYGVRRMLRTDYTSSTDTPITALRDWLLVQLRDRTTRFDTLSVMLDPAMSAALLNALLDIELHDRHHVTWDDDSASPTPYATAAHVQGIEMTVTPATWTVGVTLWTYVGE